MVGASEIDPECDLQTHNVGCILCIRCCCTDFELSVLETQLRRSKFPRLFILIDTQNKKYERHNKLGVKFIVFTVSYY